MDVVKLGEVASFKTGKLNSNAAVENGKYPFFTCSPETLRINNYAFDQEAILLAGNNAEGNFNVKYYKGKFNAYQRTYVISCNPDNTDIRYLYYALKECLRAFKHISQGTATKFLTAKILNEFEISVPPLSVQRKVSELLGSIDKRIENNEAMAGFSKQIAIDFMENIRPLLSSKQKNIPYERLRGYYYIDNSSIRNDSVRLTDAIKRLISDTQ